MSDRFDKSTYVKDCHELADATINYLDHQQAVNHPNLDKNTSMCMAGTAALAAGLSILIGGARVERAALEALIKRQMDLAYAAIDDQEPPQLVH